VGLDPKTNERYQASLQRYYEYLFSGFEHRQRVFEWQLLSSKIIFAVVLVLVFAGIYFSAVQFHVAQREKAKGEPTQLEASLSGIKVSSSVLDPGHLPAFFLPIPGSRLPDLGNLLKEGQEREKAQWQWRRCG